MADVKTLEPNGEVKVHHIPGDVTKSIVDTAIKSVVPLMQEMNASTRETLKDSIEKSLEGVAKAIEAGRIVNEEATQTKALQKARALDDLFDRHSNGDKAASTQLKKDAASFFRAIGLSKGNVEVAARSLPEHMEKTIYSASDTGTAGVLVPEQILGIMKEIRDNATVVRQFSTSSITLRGSATMPKELGLASAYYADEAEDLTISAAKWGTERIGLHKLTGLSAITNELLKDGVNVANLVLGMLTRAYANKEDAAMLRATGSSAQPTGLVNQIAAANKFTPTFTGAGTVAELHAALIKAITIPLQSNHNDAVGEQAGWILNAITWGWMMAKMTTDYSAAPFMAEVYSGRLLGSPIFRTNAQPSTLGSGDKSEIIYGRRSDAIILEGDEMTVDASRDASFKDSGGTLVSAFSKDLSVYRVIGRHNIMLLNTDAFSVIEGVPATL